MTGIGTKQGQGQRQALKGTGRSRARDRENDRIMAGIRITRTGTIARPARVVEKRQKIAQTGHF
jgi:hypothetical protein